MIITCNNYSGLRWVVIAHTRTHARAVRPAASPVHVPVPLDCSLGLVMWLGGWVRPLTGLVLFRPRQRAKGDDVSLVCRGKANMADT